MRIYIVLTVDDYVPHVKLATIDKQKALNAAKAISCGWTNEVLEEQDVAEIYFNQAESGNMEDAVSVQEIELDVS